MPFEKTSNLKKPKSIAKDSHKAHLPNKDFIIHTCCSKLGYLLNNLHESRCLPQSSIVNKLNDLYLHAVPVYRRPLLKQRQYSMQGLFWSSKHAFYHQEPNIGLYLKCYSFLFKTDNLIVNFGCFFAFIESQVRKCDSCLGRLVEPTPFLKF